MRSQRSSKWLGFVSVLTVTLFLGQTLLMDASLAWSADLIPGGDQAAPQGSARTPDAVAGQTGDQWEVTSAPQDASSNSTTYFPSGRIQSVADPAAKTVTHYTDDALNRASAIIYEDGAEEKITAYHGDTDQIKTVERRDKDKVLTHTLNYTYETVGGVQQTNLSVVGLTSMNYDMSYTRGLDGSVALKRFTLKVGSAPYAVTDPTEVYGASRLEISSWDNFLKTMLGSQVGQVSFDLTDPQAVSAVSRINNYFEAPSQVISSGWNAQSGLLTAAIQIGGYDPSASEWSIALEPSRQGSLMPFEVRSLGAKRTSAITYTDINKPQVNAEKITYKIAEFDHRGLATQISGYERIGNLDGTLLQVATGTERSDYQVFDLDGRGVVKRVRTSYSSDLTKPGYFGGHQAIANYEYGRFGNEYKSVRQTVQGPYGTEEFITDYAVFDEKAYVKFSGYKSADGSSTEEVTTEHVVIAGQVFEKHIASRSARPFQGVLTTTVSDVVMEHEVVGGHPVMISRSQVSTTTNSRDGIAIDESVNRDLIQDRYEMRDGVLTRFIRRAASLTESKNFTDLSVRRTYTQNTTLSGELTPGVYGGGLERVSMSDGITSTRQISNYSQIVARNPRVSAVLASLADLLTGAPATGDRNTYDPRTGALVQTVYINGDIKKFDSNGLVTSFMEAASGTTTTYHSGTNRIKSVTTQAGTRTFYDASGAMTRREEKNGDYELFNTSGIRIFSFEAATGKRIDYNPSTGLPVTTADGTGRVIVSDAQGHTIQDYVVTGEIQDSRQRKIKTVFSDGSYMITTYRDEPGVSASAVHSETYFSNDHQRTRTLVYNSIGTQIRWMVTGDARNLDCFFDECWKEDMGFDADWDAMNLKPAKVALIEFDGGSGHAAAVAGITRGITGSATVFSANDHIKVIEAIRTAATAGYRVINLSLEFMRSNIVGWGSALGYNADQAIVEFKSILQDAVNFARGLGATIVAAAGNQGSDFSVLAELDGVISVGSTDMKNNRVSTSGFGQALDFMAVGYKVLSQGQLWSGTSFAAPMISGMIASLSLLPNGSGGFFSESQILGAMRSTATDLGTSGWDQFFGWGKAHAGRALRSLLGL